MKMSLSVPPTMLVPTLPARPDRKRDARTVPVFLALESAAPVRKACSVTHAPFMTWNSRNKTAAVR